MSYATALLTARQVDRMRALSEGHVLVGHHDGSPVVGSPDVRLLLIQPQGRLAATRPVAALRSRLQVRC